ncbi:MAG: hypothetical protein GEU80_08145 [Dehalococcoidia bacterium]|nr:hypothetical protein [Dehalococcoidia bacterium]
MLWVAAAMLVVVIGTLTAIVVVVLFGNEDGDADDTTPAPTATAAAGGGPRLTRDIELRSAAARDSAIVTRMAAGDELHVVGRSADSSWLLVGPPERGDVTGWVPVDAVDGAEDVAALAVVEGLAGATSTPEPAVTPSETASPAPTFTPDLPDLIVESIESRDNQLTIVVRNVGIADATADLFLSINDGDPRPIDVKPGEPLRPGDAVEMVLAEEYVQRRATVQATVLTDPPIDEEQSENNTLEDVVTPDLPNDLEIVDARLDGTARWLVVTLRNNSPIPIRGPVTVRVRESPPGIALLGTETVVVMLEPDETVDVPFDTVMDVDLTRIEVRLATDSINDAVLANDRYPR